MKTIEDHLQELGTVELFPVTRPAKSGIGGCDAGKDDNAIPPRGRLLSGPSAAPEIGAVCPSEWVDLPPDYDWIVEGCFLRRTVGMLSGDGGLGKSLLLQQLCTAAAIGSSWLGLRVQQCKALALFCEDDLDELKRRQHAINQHYGIEPADLAGKLEYAPRAGMENILVEFEQGRNHPTYTPLFDQLKVKIVASGAQLVVLDTVADIFDGNENFRNQVRRFITPMRRIAMDIGGLVILVAHPSLAGMSAGTGTSGSTGWNNSVRSRIYLTRPKSKSDTTENADDDERILKTMKNNQGPAGGQIRLRWERGVFVLADGALGPSSMNRFDIDRLLLEGLRQLVHDDTRVALDPSAKTGFANLVRKLPNCKHLSWQTARDGQDRLITAGKVVKVEMGPPSKRRVYLRPADMLYPGETGEAK